MDNTYELFAKIIEAKGITPYRIAKDTGLTTVLFTDWKKGKSKPKFPKLKIIADYLGVSVGYLQGMESKQQEILDIIDNQFDTESETEISLSDLRSSLPPLEYYPNSFTYIVRKKAVVISVKIPNRV